MTAVQTASLPGETGELQSGFLRTSEHKKAVKFFKEFPLSGPEAQSES